MDYQWLSNGMTKKQAKKFIKEFEKAHEKYSIKNLGHWKSNWKKELKHADLKNGFWYWKGHKLANLANIVSSPIH